MNATGSVAFKALLQRKVERLLIEPTSEAMNSLWWAGRFLHVWHVQLYHDRQVPLTFGMRNTPGGVPLEALDSYLSEVSKSFTKGLSNLPLFAPTKPNQSLFQVFLFLEARLEHLANHLGCSYEDAIYEIFESYRLFAADPANKKALRGQSKDGSSLYVGLNDLDDSAS